MNHLLPKGTVIEDLDSGDEITSNGENLILITDVKRKYLNYIHEETIIRDGIEMDVPLISTIEDFEIISKP